MKSRGTSFHTGQLADSPNYRHWDPADPDTRFPYRPISRLSKLNNYGGYFRAAPSFHTGQLADSPNSWGMCCRRRTEVSIPAN